MSQEHKPIRTLEAAAGFIRKPSLSCRPSIRPAEEMLVFAASNWVYFLNFIM